MGVFGVTLGVAIWAAVALLGLNLLLEKMAWLHQIIMLGGGIYLLWMGWQLLRSARHQHRHPPVPAVTLLSCDNLRHNGERFRQGFLTFLQHSPQRSLADWVRDNTTSPNTMVDRITPRPTADIAERVLQATGVKDAVPVMGEAFIQWVIEDNFIAADYCSES